MTRKIFRIKFHESIGLNQTHEIENSPVASLRIILFKKRITKMLIRLRGCACVFRKPLKTGFLAARPIFNMGFGCLKEPSLLRWFFSVSTKGIQAYNFDLCRGQHWQNSKFNIMGMDIVSKILWAKPKGYWAPVSLFPAQHMFWVRNKIFFWGGGGGGGWGGGGG